MIDDPYILALRTYFVVLSSLPERLHQYISLGGVSLYNPDEVLYFIYDIDHPPYPIDNLVRISRYRRAK